MNRFIKDAFVFVRQNPAILYSLALIILLPLILYANTFWTIQSFDEAIMNNIKDQAAINRDMLTMLLSPAFQDKSSPDVTKLQQIIDQINAVGNEGAKDSAQNASTEVNKGQKLENIRVIVKKGLDYIALAAQNRDILGKPINTGPSLNGEVLFSYSWSNATKDWGATIEEDGKKYFRFIKPLLDPATNEVYALITADISIDEVVVKIRNAVFLAYAMLVAAILVSLFLVFQHTRLFSFVALSKTLQAQNKAKDDFIRMATHELRSPVTVINMYMETLKEELAAVTNDEQKKSIERILISIRNLRDLMSDILEVSHLQQGRTDFKPEKVAPAAAIKEIIEGVRPKAREKGLELSFEGENFPYGFNVNLVCFKRIITNLIENSIKYTPAGKIAVSLRAEPAKKRVVVIVQDTGLGISAEGQKRLFEQFYRVKTHETEEIPGTGLGLWMSREMARKMGGDIMLESIEHIGSRFFATFPLADK